MRKDVLDLIKSAEEDIDIARYSLEKEFYNQACFHAQQAVEKYLKALGLKYHGKYKITHDITALVNELPEEDRKYLYELNADILTKYYTGTRYPPLMSLSEEEAEEAVEIAEKVREFVRERI